MIRQIGVCLSIESTEDAGVFVLPFCLQMVSDNIPRQHKPERIQATAFSGFAPHQAAISGVCPSEILTHNVRGGSVPCGWVTSHVHGHPATRSPDSDRGRGRNLSQGRGVLERGRTLASNGVLKPDPIAPCDMDRGSPSRRVRSASPAWKAVGPSPLRRLFY